LQIPVTYLFVMMISLVIFFALMFILSGLKILKEWERVVVMRLGRYHSTKGPGIIWIVPILDKIVLRIPIREQTTEIDTGKYVSSHGSSIRLKGSVQWKVVDAERFALGMQDHYQTILKTIQHHMVEVADSSTNDAAFADSDELNYLVQIALEPNFQKWGLEVKNVDLHVAVEG
jgi:regulator of protease activity HflC (stomatin/prohibitin superfamily)